MTSNCNTIYFCHTIKNGFGASGKAREKEATAMDGRCKERNRTKKGRRKMEFTLLLHSLTFSLLWIMAHTLFLSLHVVYIPLPTACLPLQCWFPLSIIIWKYRSLALSSAQNIESYICFALEWKQWLKIQIIFILIIFILFYDTVFGIYSWKYWPFVIVFLSVYHLLITMISWSLVQSLH